MSEPASPPTTEEAALIAAGKLCSRCRTPPKIPPSRAKNWNGLCHGLCSGCNAKDYRIIRAKRKTEPFFMVQIDDQTPIESIEYADQVKVTLRVEGVKDAADMRNLPEVISRAAQVVLKWAHERLVEARKKGSAKRGPLEPDVVQPGEVLDVAGK